VSAALQMEIKSQASIKISFVGLCAGVAAEAINDRRRRGADVALTSTHDDQHFCDEWTMDTEHPKYCKYTDDNKKPCEDAKVLAAAGGLVIAGGA